MRVLAPGASDAWVVEWCMQGYALEDSHSIVFKDEAAAMRFFNASKQSPAIKRVLLMRQQVENENVVEMEIVYRFEAPEGSTGGLAHDPRMMRLRALQGKYPRIKS